MTWAFLFIFGAAIGSFLNVVALRYDGERFLFDPKGIGGRSHCPHCRTTLRWFELVPILSFIALRGRCRTCRTRIGFQYPLVEFISGLIFVGVPWRVVLLYNIIDPGSFAAFSFFWIIVFELLLLMAYVDIRLGIIPDEVTVFLVATGIFLAIFSAWYSGALNIPILGAYSSVLWSPAGIWSNRILGAAFGAAFFGALVLGTRGKGIGMGDVKLALPLGFLFGWPEIIFLSALAFVLGAVVGVGAMVARRKTMKSSLPFGPFLALAGAMIFFYGAEMFGAYLKLLLK